MLVPWKSPSRVEHDRAPRLSANGRSRWLAGFAGIVALLLPLAVIVAIVFPRAGQFLVVEDRFDHADLAIILSGDPIRRSLAARDLYTHGRINQILVIPEPYDPTDQELERLGLLTPNSQAWPQRILVTSGVPLGSILTLPQPADGTIVEALRVRELFEEGLPPRSVVIVTSKFASRRARFIFRHILKDDLIQVFAYPTPYDPFHAEHWWSPPRNALQVVMEYQKFLMNAMQLALHLYEIA